MRWPWSAKRSPASWRAGRDEADTDTTEPVPAVYARASRSLTRRADSAVEVHEEARQAVRDGVARTGYPASPGADDGLSGLLAKGAE
jgi:hypothetical protein